MFFCFFWLRKLPEYYFLAQAFANLHGKLGPKNNIPEVSLTKKAKKHYYVGLLQIVNKKTTKEEDRID